MLLIKCIKGKKSPGYLIAFGVETGGLTWIGIELGV